MMRAVRQIEQGYLQRRDVGLQVLDAFRLSRKFGFPLVELRGSGTPGNPVKRAADYLAVTAGVCSYEDIPSQPSYDGYSALVQDAEMMVAGCWANHRQFFSIPGSHVAKRVFAVGAGLSAGIVVVLVVLGASMESMLFAAGTAVSFLIGMTTMGRVGDLTKADVDNAHQSE